MDTAWDPELPGVLQLPSGRLVRGRPLRRPLPTGPLPDFALYLKRTPPPPTPWQQRWIAWPDLRLPTDYSDAEAAFRQAWLRAASERVEVGCYGGHGRTGSALACIAILDGVQPEEAIAFIRLHYSSRAVETPGQRRFVRRFPQDRTLR